MKNLGIYCLGGGLGHMHRTASLVRHAAQRSICCHVLVNSHCAKQFVQTLRQSPLFSPFFEAGLIHYNIHSDRWSLETARDESQQWCTKGRWDGFLVDTFPRGLGGELVDWLPEVKVPKFLIARSLDKQYAEICGYSRASDWYDRIFLPGDGDQFEKLAREDHRWEETSPWLMLNSDELLEKQKAFTRMGFRSQDTAKVLLIGSGKKDEMQWMEAFFARLKKGNRFRGFEFRYFSFSDTAGEMCCNDREPYWPLLQFHPVFDLVIGAGGYNTTSECLASKTPLWAFGQKRLYDDQVGRLKEAGFVVLENEGDLIQRLANLDINSLRQPDSCELQFVSGSVQAVSRIYEFLYP